MWSFLTLIFVVLALGAIWIRIAPHDVDKWHIDPAETADPGVRGLQLIGRDAPRFPGHPDEVLAAFADIVTANPRAKLLDGGVEEGMITFVIRTKIMAFPDYMTVKATAEGDETKLSLLARTRFGLSDGDLNRERLEYLLGELDRELR
jgi:hypothetical protein